MTQTAATAQTGVPLAALVAAAVLMGVQVLVTRVRGAVSPRSIRFRSVAGGLAVGYVFARLLPQLAVSSTAGSTSTGGALGVLQRHPFLVALAGLLLWFAVLDLSQQSSRREHDRAARRQVDWPFACAALLLLL